MHRYLSNGQDGFSRRQFFEHPGRQLSGSPRDPAEKKGAKSPTDSTEKQNFKRSPDPKEITWRTFSELCSPFCCALFDFMLHVFVLFPEFM